MTNRQFLVGFFATAVLMAIIEGILCAVPATAPWCLLGWTGYAVYLLLTVVMFYYARSAAMSPNKNRFTSAVMGLTTLKLMVTVGLLFGWTLFSKPDSAFFVLPVLATYAGFTGYEIYFMLRLSKIPSPKEM